MASNSNNTNNYNDDKNKVEPNSNIALLLRLLSNPANLQQMLASMTQTTSASSAIVGSAQNPIMKEEWIQWKKTKKLEEDWKDFLHLPHATYWTYRFKREFPTFPISVGDFVLQKISENILGNWVETERKKKVKEAYDKGILPPPKRVLPSTNITSPTTNSIEIDSDEAEENIDALSKLLETEDDASTKLYSSKSSASITRSKKTFSRNNSGKKKMAKANSKRAAKKQIIKEIGSDENESGDNIDAEFFSSELPETDVDAITELFVPTTQTKRAIEKLSDISNQPSTQA
ncbi:13385_t:CDS:2 [Gigaspora rosea]|nr:13385_t:CDS:2 [Gigaspora rosea]